MYKLKIVLLAFVMGVIALPSSADQHSVIATDEIDWGLLNPLRGDASPRAADLWGDRTKDVATGMLVKFSDGFSSPPHIHNVTYRGVVIKGQVHNDDPGAETMWLSTGSFWTQPAGESHITAANGQENLIYLEIDSGPYLVRSSQEAFDNGERPVNLDQRNLVWLDAEDIKWLDKKQTQIAYLWGEPQARNGSFVKLPAGFKGTIRSNDALKAVVVSGEASYRWSDEENSTWLSPGSFFSSGSDGKHHMSASTPLLLYINAIGRYTIQ